MQMKKIEEGCTPTIIVVDSVIKNGTIEEVGDKRFSMSAWQIVCKYVMIH